MTDLILPSLLIIDDDRDFCMILQMNLKELAVIHIEYTLEEAAAWLESNTPFLILLDYHLPDGFGTDLINLLKEKNKQTSIIVLTADTSHRIREESIAAGAVYFFCKPFNMDTIKKVISSFL